MKQLSIFDAAPISVVGVDAYIDPAGCTGFTEIFGESEPSHWADRVVGPYGEISIHSYPVGADDSVRPQNISVLRKSSAKSQLPSGPMWASAPTGLRRIRTALQLLNARLIYRSDSNATTYKFGVL